jgi:hypothetical protein
MVSQRMWHLKWLQDESVSKKGGKIGKIIQSEEGEACAETLRVDTVFEGLQRAEYAWSLV